MGNKTDYAVCHKTCSTYHCCLNR